MRPLFKTLVATAAALLCGSLSFAGTLGYFPQGTPDGIVGGWTYPSGAPSYFGQGVLSADSAIYTLKPVDGRFAVTPLNTYRQAIRVFPADLDGDGFGDLIVSFVESGGVRLLIGNADGDSFNVSLPPLPSPVLAATAVRFDSDSLVDLVLADSTRITVLTRNEPGPGGDYEYTLFKEIPVMQPGANHPLASLELLSGDYNGDYRTDLIYNGILYINLGNRRILTRELPVPPGVKVRLLNLSVDFDGDNKQELLWSSAASADQPSAVTVADYDANLIFRAATVLQPGLYDVTRVFRFDSDGDGRLELGLYSAIDARAVAYRSTAGILDPTSASELFSAAPPRGLFIGPLPTDSNGETPWLFHNAISDSIYAGYVRRPYSDASAAVGLADTLAGQAVAVGDYNGDNLPDIYVVNYTGDNALYRGEPDGTFSQVAPEAGVAQGNDGISCAWGDFNNDGYQDLIVAGLWLPDKLFFNRGDGTFADSSSMLRYSRGRQRATSVSWGDVNRDGWLDLLLTNYDGANWLLTNHGGRYFDNSGPDLGSTDGFNRTENAMIIDVDRDGWLDIVLLNDGGPARLLRGKSGGQFDDATAGSGLNPESDFPRLGQSQSWGDFNGDGYPDLFITRAADKAMMFLNNGPGASQRFRLVYAGNAGGGQYARIASAIEDFDGDGRTDLLITRTSQFGSNSEIPLDQVFLGDARGYPLIDSDAATSANLAGEALIEPLRRFPRETSLPVAGDFDRDGDIDVLYVNYLPDNASDLFSSSALPLIYMRNNSGRANTITVILKRTDNRNLPGTSVRLFHSGRSYCKTVSGGGGRIQSGPFLTFSLGDAAAADSMNVRWSDGLEQTRPGPFYPGELELIVDFTPPSMALLSAPEGEVRDELSTLVTASPLPLSGTIRVKDNGGLSQVSAIVIRPDTGSSDTLLLTGKADGEYMFSLSTPAPGDSLKYFFSAVDTYGNISRLPSDPSLYYTLIAREGVYVGDINGDGKINSTDISALLAILRKSGEPITDIQRESSDINLDGEVNIFDLLDLLALLKLF